MKDIERLLLINQFEILQRLNPEEASFYNEKIEVLREGFEYHYSDIFDELNEPLDAQESKFVLDILSMYRDIYFSKEKIQNYESEKLTHFRGFDYNDDRESKLGSYARFFVETLDRFQELVEDPDFESFNSHRPMIGQYKRFLSQYEQVKNSQGYKYGNLNSNQIEEILR